MIQSAYVVPHPPIILPEIGRGEERKIQKTIDGFRKAAEQIAEAAPETILLASPHTTLYSDFFHISPGQKAQGDMSRFGTPQVRVEAEYDQALVRMIEQNAKKAGIPAGTAGERDPRLDHATVIPLRFVDQAWHETQPKYKLVRIGLSGLSLRTHFEFGKCIAESIAALARSAVFIASGDLSHRLKADGPYGFVKEGPEFDRQITEIMKTGDFNRLFELDENLCDRAGECGLRSIAIMAGVLDGINTKAELISYEGPFGVGYGISSYLPE